MGDPNVYQQLGALQAQVKTLDTGQRDMRTEQRAMNAKLDTLLERSVKQRAARAILWKIGSISGAIGALVISFLQWLQSTRHP